MSNAPKNNKTGNERPKPANYGFDIDFDDLSAAKPLTRAVPTPPKSKAKPKPKPVTKPKARRAPKPSQDAVAKSMGFTSREPSAPVLLKRRRRIQHDEPVDQLSVRGPVRVLNAFIAHCEADNLSYWEGLEALLEAKTS